MTAPLHPNCRCGTIQVLTDQTEEELEAMRDIKREAALQGLSRRINQWFSENPSTDADLDPSIPRNLVHQWESELGLERGVYNRIDAELEKIHSRLGQ